jgi:multiple sugar transport system substrate-binding protein
VRPLTPLYAQLSDLLQRQVNGLLSGEGTAAIAMAKAQNQSSVLLAAAAGPGGT